MLLLCLFISNKTLAQGTIVDVAVGNENFSTLVTALKAADLVAALQSEGPFTVLLQQIVLFQRSIQRF